MAREKWTMERLQASMERAKRGELSHPHKGLMERLEGAIERDPALRQEVEDHAKENEGTLANAYINEVR